MKKLLFFIIAILFSVVSLSAQQKIEIVYLTANAYCPSVEQIEHETKAVLDSLFTKEKADGVITERKLNIMEEENQDFIHKWEISTNGLVLFVYNGNLVEKVDLNDFAFSNVPSDIPFFKKGFADKIATVLKQGK